MRGVDCIVLQVTPTTTRVVPKQWTDRAEPVSPPVAPDGTVILLEPESLLILSELVASLVREIR